MRINLPHPSPSTLTLTGIGRGSAGWRLGQVLEAVALAPSAQGRVTLRIGDSTVEARTPVSVAAGQSLKLEVLRLGQQPILKLLNMDLVEADPASLAFRSALPRQAALGPLLANLAALGGNPPNGALPPRVVELAAALLRQLPDSAMLGTPERLQQALLDSGLFLEGRLASGATSGELAGDFKAGLLRLLETLRTDTPDTARPADLSGGQAPPPLRGGFPHPQAAVPPAALDHLPPQQAPAELLHQAEGALARLQLNQLASLPAAGDERAVWTTELPVRRDGGSDVIGLRIEQERDKGSKEAARHNWTVSLAFDLPGLGPVRARVSARGEQVAATFWAEREETVRLFQEHLDMLHRQLTDAGLEVGALACHTGVPADAVHNAYPRRLLDERA